MAYLLSPEFGKRKKMMPFSAFGGPHILPKIHALRPWCRGMVRRGQPL
jgi:hypothetical protein